MRTLSGGISFLLVAAVFACGGSSAPTAPAASAETDPPVQLSPADEFLARLRQHCGKAFAGKVVTNEPPQPNDAFAGKPLVMHVRECGDTELKVPFHVGEDHSRTWVITRTAAGLRLKHDHRHQDGSSDAVTMYGGDTREPGTATRQQFPVDADSIATFESNKLAASITNTWALEIEPGKRFLYELSRPGGRLFKVEFDLATPVAAPPTPWGHPELP
jgi:hypothetical protein